MIYEGSYGTVNFFEDSYLKTHKRVWVSISGGTDSALVFEMLCREPSIEEITPYTGIETSRPKHIYFVNAIVDYFRKKYPNKVIRDVVSKTFEVSKDVRKNFFIRKIQQDAIKMGLVDVFVQGMTSNPSEQVMIENHMFAKNENRRSGWSDKDQVIHLHAGIGLYRPLLFVTKQFVAEMYQKLNLMDDLYPLTTSCTGYAEETKDWMIPCEKCFWCLERKWAFGTYDLNNWKKFDK